MQRRPLRDLRVEERKVKRISMRVPLDTNASKPQIVQQPVCPLLKCRTFAYVFGHLLTSSNSELLQDLVVVDHVRGMHLISVLEMSATRRTADLRRLQATPDKPTSCGIFIIAKVRTKTDE